MKSVAIKATQEGDEHWMVVLLLAASRLVNLEIDSYTDLLKTKILNQMKLLGFDGAVLPPKTLYDTWPLGESYNAMAVAIDMFLSKFNTHQLIYARISTLRSRFRDCSGLLTLGFFCNLVGMESESDVLD